MSDRFYSCFIICDGGRINSEVCPDFAPSCRRVACVCLPPLGMFFFCLPHKHVLVFLESHIISSKACGPTCILILDSHPHLGWDKVEFLSYSPSITGAVLEVSVEQADLEPRDHLPLASALGLKAVPQHLTSLSVVMKACSVADCLSTAIGISAFSR